jgi:hypothetical protein
MGLSLRGGAVEDDDVARLDRLRIVFDDLAITV